MASGVRWVPVGGIGDGFEAGICAERRVMAPAAIRAMRFIGALIVPAYEPSTAIRSLAAKHGNNNVTLGCASPEHASKTGQREGDRAAPEGHKLRGTPGFSDSSALPTLFPLQTHFEQFL
eukprot:634580-Alexandrium_andersonii.AAC.1